MTEKHLAIFKGEIKEVHWDIRREEIKEYSKNKTCVEYKTSVVSKIRTLRLDEIWSGEIPKPVLATWESIWINDLELLVTIGNKYRTTNGEVIYETMHVIDTIITEYSENSRLEAIDKWFDLEYPNLKTFEQLNNNLTTEEIIDNTIKWLDSLDNKPEPIPTWEVKDKPKKNTWFGWLFNK